MKKTLKVNRIPELDTVPWNPHVKSMDSTFKESIKSYNCRVRQIGGIYRQKEYLAISSFDFSGGYFDFTANFIISSLFFCFKP